MLTEKPFRRLPLRDLLTDAGKRTHDISEQLSISWIQRITDLRELSRPLRKRSHYPTMLAMINAYEKADQTHQEVEKMLDYLTQELTNHPEDVRDGVLARAEDLMRGMQE